MTIFEKGTFNLIEEDFLDSGKKALEALEEFQRKFKIYDTDTSINSIRDAIVAKYLKFELINNEKHGFDAQKKDEKGFLEIKQCSITSSEWNGVWNDTTEEKAKAFSEDNVFVAVALWETAMTLKFIVYGQNKEIGNCLLQKVKNIKKATTRPTPKISVLQLITKYNFRVLCLEETDKQGVYDMLLKKYPSLKKKLKKDDIKTIRDI